MGPARRLPSHRLGTPGCPPLAGRSVIAEAEGPPAMAGRDRVAPRALVPKFGRGFLFSGGVDVVAITAANVVDLVPVTRERLADLETPVSAFAKLRALGGAFLLESVEGGERMGRYSFIGLSPRTTLTFRDGAAARAIDRVFAKLDGPLPAFAPNPSAPAEVRPNGTPMEYMARVARARELIADGDCIQIVLAQRFDVRPAPDALALYRALRHVNPSPYMFLLETAAATLVGASPEPFVRVEGGKVVMHPIAGTRPRGADAGEDAANEAELRSSEKERAEHVMLVDLARNDIGRVSRAGTVRVKELMRVDRFSHVMHLTSVVEGELAAGLDALDAFRACFPAGTVSGAPKIRAMERIAELEPDQRGPYAGAVGYLGFDGALDTCITIRTAVLAKGVCRIQAGAGIVADSDPKAEEAETRAKARALLRAIEMLSGMDAIR